MFKRIMIINVLEGEVYNRYMKYQSRKRLTERMELIIGKNAKFHLANELGNCL